MTGMCSFSMSQYLLSILVCCCFSQLVTSQVIVESPQHQSVCEGGMAIFECMVMFTAGMLGTNYWLGGTANDASRLLGHTATDDSNGRCAPANVTNVLTVTNVDISYNGTGYAYFQNAMQISSAAVLTVFGPPDDVTDVNISPNTTTACSLVVQWSAPFSHSVCDSVRYTVTISTKEGILITTDNTTMTNYTVTGLNNSTWYSVSVTASNNAGSSNSAGMSVMTNNYGLPSNPPKVMSVTPLTSTSFNVTWISSDPTYTVIWVNLNTGMMNSFTVSENITNYTVTGLSGADNYNVSVAAVDVCGNKTSDPITVYGPPDDVTDVNISPNTTTACSLVVQWSAPSSDPVCGPVWYTVTISTEGGILITTDITTMTNYTVTGLNDNTVYHVNVTASNNAGSSHSTGMWIMTNDDGLPSNPPKVMSVIPLSSTSFTVTWTNSDPTYDYTVIWTNLNTGVMKNFIVPKNLNSYTVTELSEADHYNVSVAAVGMCGNKTSDPITVYGYGPRDINIKIFTISRDELSATGSCSSFHDYQCCMVIPVLTIKIKFKGLSPTVTVGVANVDGNMSGTKPKAPSSTRIADDSEGTYGFYFYISMVLIVLVATVVVIAIYWQLRRDEIVDMDPIQAEND